MLIIPMLETEIGRLMKKYEKEWVRQMLNAGNEEAIKEWVRQMQTANGGLNPYCIGCAED